MTDDERERLRTPFWCPICDVPMKRGSGGDDKTYFKWGCCRHCYIEFVEEREERWRSGWRPSKEDVRLFYDKLGW